MGSERSSILGRIRPLTPIDVRVVKKGTGHSCVTVMADTGQDLAPS